MTDLQHNLFRVVNLEHNDRVYASRLKKYVRNGRKLIYAVNDLKGNFKGFITAKTDTQAVYFAGLLGCRLHYARDREVYPLLKPTAR